MLRKAALAAIGVAGLALPSITAAQPYYGSAYGQSYQVQYYGQPRGDYYGNGWGRRFGGYPEFRGIEAHIRNEIQEGVREDLIEPDDARDLFSQLRNIQGQEAREFRVHGWNLPDDDRYRLQSRLQQLDALVDQVRAEPED